MASTLLVTRKPHKPLLILMMLIVTITRNIIIIGVHKAITERINAMLHG
jgi:hypothetical protein